MQLLSSNRNPRELRSSTRLRDLKAENREAAWPTIFPNFDSERSACSPDTTTSYWELAFPSDIYFLSSKNSIRFSPKRKKRTRSTEANLKFDISVIETYKTAPASSIAFAILRGVQLSRLKKVAQPTYIDTYIYVRMCVCVCDSRIIITSSSSSALFSFFFFKGVFRLLPSLSLSLSLSPSSLLLPLFVMRVRTYNRYKYKSQANIS